MAGHKADEKIPGNLGNLGQQIGKIHAAVQILTVGVHILTQQGNLLGASGNQLPALLQNILRLPAPLPAPDIGDNAVGAEVVAAVHDGDPGLQGVVPQLGKSLRNGAGLILGIEGALAGGEHLIQKLGELPQMMGGKDTVYMGIAFANPLHHLHLSSHAAAEKNLLLRVAALGVGQRPKIAEHPLLCVFPDGAGVHHHHIRSLGRVADGVAAFAEQSPDLLGICFILLAAVGLHIGGGNPVFVQPVLADFMTKGKLLLQLLLRNHCGFGIHGKTPFGILTQL